MSRENIERECLGSLLATCDDLKAACFRFLSIQDCNYLKIWLIKFQLIDKCANHFEPLAQVAWLVALNRHSD